MRMFSLGELGLSQFVHFMKKIDHFVVDCSVEMLCISLIQVSRLFLYLRVNWLHARKHTSIIHVFIFIVHVLSCYFNDWPDSF